MFKAIMSVTIFGIFALGLPTPAKAVDPVTGFVASYLSGALVDEVWGRAAGKPNIRLLDRRLKELEQDAVLHDDMRKEIAKLRAGITNRITRDEFRAMTERVSSEIGAIKRRLDSLEERVERLEVENADLKAGTKNAASATYFVQRAEQLSKKRETERAIANLNIAPKIDPACASAYRGRCEVYARLGAWGVVLADTTEALSQLKRPEAWLFRQRALARAKVWSLRPCNFTLSQPHTKSPRIHDADLKTFLDDCAQALADNPADAAVLCVHGLSRIHAGDEIKPPLQLNEGVAAFIARQAALRRPSYDAALADFNAAIEADARNAGVLRPRGRARPPPRPSGRDRRLHRVDSLRSKAKGCLRLARVHHC